MQDTTETNDGGDGGEQQDTTDTGTDQREQEHPDSIIDLSQYLDLSPASWPDGEEARYWQIHDNAQPHKSGTSSGAMITGTSGPVAIRAGLEALNQGGTAADAIVTTALSQIVLAAGSWVSFAGRMTAVYFDAATGEVHSMNANYNVPINESSPLTIPSEPTPDGRTTLVPGFMRGLESFHERYGSLDWPTVFTPAIYLAEEGFVIRGDIANVINFRRDVLARLPDTRKIFTKPDGSWYGFGDLFKQTELGLTLRHVAAEGADYMYTGEWADRLIDALQAEGGLMVIQDLERYEPTWSTPVTAEFGPFTVHGLPSPNLGGPISVEILSVLGQSGLMDIGDYTESAEVLFGMFQAEYLPFMIRDAGDRAALEATVRVDGLGEGNVSEEAALKLWEFMQTPEWQTFKQSRGYPSSGAGASTPHSDAVVVIDAQGNMGAILHTINALAWGTTGIFVDGVSIPNSAAFQQNWVAEAGPGGRVKDAGPPTIVTYEGRPVLGSSAAGGWNIQVNWQNAFQILGRGMRPSESVNMPQFNFHTVTGGEFPQPLIDSVRAMGQVVNIRQPSSSGNGNGFWAGISVDTTTGERHGGVIRWNNGIVLH